MRQERILEQLATMLESGRITEEESAALQAAENPQEFERALGTVRARHAAERTKAAVAAGEMSQEEADGCLEQLRNGAHPKGLRARLAPFGDRARPPG